MALSGAEALIEPQLSRRSAAPAGFRTGRDHIPLGFCIVKVESHCISPILLL
jgi:hypothetical protein